MISKTKIKDRISRKTNVVLQETIRLANKNKAWNKLAALLSQSTRKQTTVNLFDLDKKTSAGDTIVIPGRVLSSGELTKKLRICALGISESAKDRLKSTKSEFVLLVDEIKKNPKAEGIKILR